MDNYFDEPNSEPINPEAPAEAPTELPPETPEKKGYHVRVFSLVIAIVLGIAGAYLWAMSSADFRAKKAAYGKYSETVVATQSGVPLCLSDTGNACTLVYEYEVDGKTYTKTFDTLSGIDILNAGNQLRYDPNNPADAILPENTIDPDASLKKWEDAHLMQIGLGLLALAAIFMIDAFLAV